MDIKSNKTTSKKITNLKKGKTYYVRICAYKNSNGQKVYGNYSNVKKFKIK
ncbi:MAG: fibronectin type III domain-containing protein [Lachnospiraceae bacterium]|nr:fibronectin type III domain-containing protein [Lachnospiraceae bacterium]